MRNVSVEEAQNCLTNLQHLSSQKSKPHSLSTNKMDEWIYKPIYPQEINNYDIKALSPNIAVQRYWTTASEFPLCPKQASDTPLEDYFNNLKRNANLTKNQFNSSCIIKFEMNGSKDTIFVLCQVKAKNKKSYAVTKIIYENNFFIHINCGYIAETEKTTYKELIPKLEEMQKAKQDFLRHSREREKARQQEIVQNELNFNIADYDIQAILPNIAKQRFWTTPTEFPLCPKQAINTPLDDYFKNLEKGATFLKNKNNSASILEFAFSKDKNSILIVCEFDESAIKPYAFAQVIYENNFFIHINLGSFFEKNGAYKQWTLAQGLEWTGGDSIDDYC